MPSIRIAAAGAALLVLSRLTAGGAAAQTITDQAPGGPLAITPLAARRLADQQTSDEAPPKQPEKDHTFRGRIYKHRAASNGDRSGITARPHVSPATISPHRQTTIPRTTLAPTPPAV